MKKILSLTLAVLMVVSMIPTAFAADVDYKNGTEVEYTGSRSTVEDDGSVTHNAEYTITVPALLAPGGSGTVTLEGYWPSDATVKVTAEEKVEVVNDINSADKKELAVTFASIEKAGSNTAVVTASAPVSVANIENALFGKWAGKFNYNVEYNGAAGGSGTITPTPDPEQPGDGDVVTSEGSATFSKYLTSPGCHNIMRDHTEACYTVEENTLSWDELLLEENVTKYEYSSDVVNNSTVYTNAFRGNKNLTSITIPEGITAVELDAFHDCTSLTSVTIPVSLKTINYRGFQNCTSLTTIKYAGTTAQWGAINFRNNDDWKENVPATEVICSDGTVALS